MPFLFPTGASARDALDVLGAFPITFEAITPALISGNLLSLDQQRAQAATVTSTLATTTKDPTGGADGGGAITSTATSTNVNTQFAVGPVGVAAFPVAASTSYTLTARLQQLAGTGTWFLEMAWYTSAGVYITSTTSAATTLTTGVRLTVAVTGASPANAAFATFVVRKTVVAVGDAVETSVLCLRTSATIPFSVGLRALLSGVPLGVNNTFGGTGCLRRDPTTGEAVVVGADLGGCSYGFGPLPDAWFDSLGKLVRASVTARLLPPATTNSCFFRFGNGTVYVDVIQSIAASAINAIGVTMVGPGFVMAGPSIIVGPSLGGASFPNGAEFRLAPFHIEVTA